MLLGIGIHPRMRDAHGPQLVTLALIARFTRETSLWIASALCQRDGVVDVRPVVIRLPAVDSIAHAIRPRIYSVAGATAATSDHVLRRDRRLGLIRSLGERDDFVGAVRVAQLVQQRADPRRVEELLTVRGKRRDELDILIA